MSRRLVKWSLLASVLLLVLPVVAGASTARLMGMGVQGDFVKDYTNIYTYPSCLPNVGNLVFGELGQVTNFDAFSEYKQYYVTQDRSVGAVLGNLFDGRFGAIGFTMREITPALGTNFQPLVSFDTNYNYMFGSGFDTFSSDGFVDPLFTFNEAFDLMWGKKFDKLSLGLRLNRSFYKETRTDLPDVEGFGQNGANMFGFGGGVGFDLSDKSMLEGSFLYQSRTFKDPAATFEDTDGTLENDGGGAYMASVRMLWQWKPDVMLVPMGRYYSFDLSEKFTPTDPALADVTTDVKLHGWQVGAAGNWTLNQNDLFVLGLSFGQNVLDNKSGDEKISESLMPSMFAALETHVNPWLTVRFGARKGVFYSWKDELTAAPSSEDKFNESPFQFFLGTGVKLGTLQLDATLAQDFFHNPASYVTNESNDFAPLFPRVTATYSF